MQGTNPDIGVVGLCFFLVGRNLSTNKIARATRVHPNRSKAYQSRCHNLKVAGDAKTEDRQSEAASRVREARLSLADMQLKGRGSEDTSNYFLLGEEAAMINNVHQPLSHIVLGHGSVTTVTEKTLGLFHFEALEGCILLL
ncbi:hypothetical protein Hamer_G008410 [Homarus americanus]|uniref:Uncharacterized protein n=1 Tax=Homarus americanus TaxID=6706 RepID=A0A8J5NCD1_HOMAM|nr:hypothetical protein Hamer_G008410 [Homarus americanus]